MNITIIRGLPGSGKSTSAMKLQAETGAIVIEPDMFLVEQGRYQYTAERYAAAVERSYVMLELLTGCEFDRRDAVLRPDIIYTDVLPMIGDIAELIRHVNPYYQIRVVTMRKMPDLRRADSNRHGVKAKDLLRMVRVFDDIEYIGGKFMCRGRLYHGFGGAE